MKNQQNDNCVVVLTRYYYGGRSESLLLDVHSGNKFSTRTEAREYVKQQLIHQRAFPMLGHNESSLPTFAIYSVRHPIAKKLLKPDTSP